MLGLEERFPNQFTMKWRGFKTPQGAKIGGVPITHMKDGQIMGGGQVLGIYGRTEEFAGPNRDEHTVLINTHHTTVDPPPGGEVTYSDIITKAREI